ncbi:hypothetical protein ISN44_As06g047830 [Arabidopsis suecica]|uniref:Uncharacterized protein n=1 Tax=Arabidopsis suecica TaxID=45249 RepID=A0A8T2D165_ARASU|nr:hypothetical protein ISN44_As06g047830 [Arabidopsis suecica]
MNPNCGSFPNPLADWVSLRLIEVVPSPIRLLNIHGTTYFVVSVAPCSLLPSPAQLSSSPIRISLRFPISHVIEKAKKLREQNKRSRSQYKTPHTLGKKSFA